MSLQTYPLVPAAGVSGQGVTNKLAYWSSPGIVASDDLFTIDPVNHVAIIGPSPSAFTDRATLELTTPKSAVGLRVRVRNEGLVLINEPTGILIEGPTTELTNRLGDYIGLWIKDAPSMAPNGPVSVIGIRSDVAYSGNSLSMVIGTAPSNFYGPVGIGVTGPAHDASPLSVSLTRTLGSSSTQYSSISAGSTLTLSASSALLNTVVQITAITNPATFTSSGVTAGIDIIARASGSTGTVSLVAGVRASVDNTATGVGTITVGTSFQALAPTKSANGVITEWNGIRIEDSTVAVNTYGVRSRVFSGTNKYNIYADGTAPSHFAGDVRIGLAVGTGAKLEVSASSTTTGTIGITAINIYTTNAGTGNANVVGVYVAPPTNTGGGILQTWQAFVTSDPPVMPALVTGYRSAISSGANRYNIFCDSLAYNYLGGATGIGIVPPHPTGVALYVGGNVLYNGSGAGFNCQNVGSMGGNGYSNTIAIGWDGTLKCRVDTTQIGTITVTASDERVKINIQQNVPGLDAVKLLRTISFEYDQTKRAIGFPHGRRYGLVAQEAQAHVPLVIENDGSEEQYLTIDYPGLVPVLIKAMQELSQNYETRIEALETRIEVLEAR